MATCDVLDQTYELNELTERVRLAIEKSGIWKDGDFLYVREVTEPGFEGCVGVKYWPNQYRFNSLLLSRRPTLAGICSVLGVGDVTNDCEYVNCLIDFDLWLESEDFRATYLNFMVSMRDFKDGNLDERFKGEILTSNRDLGYSVQVSVGMFGSSTRCEMFRLEENIVAALGLEEIRFRLPTDEFLKRSMSSFLLRRDYRLSVLAFVPLFEKKLKVGG